MYVLMDIEWVTDGQDQIYPTQIAALRADTQWETEVSYYARIQPQDPMFFKWDHMGYTGGYANEFLSAPPLVEVEKQLLQWLKPDDILCWWREESNTVFHTFFPQIGNTNLALFPHISSYLHYSPYLIGSEYHIASQFGIKRGENRHFAAADVETMCLALYLLKFPQELLEIPVEVHHNVFQPQLHTFILDLNQQIIHDKNCDRIQTASAIRETVSIDSLLGKGNRPCPCCAESYRKALRKRNRDTIARSEYCFVYTPDSRVFHTRNCDRILAAEQILGTVKYMTCLDTGRSPCRVCNPTVADESYRYLKQAEIPRRQSHKKLLKTSIPVKMPPKPEKNPKPNNPYGRSLTLQEERAMQRFIIAKAEREQLSKNTSLTSQERADALTLTQPSYAFWAASGFGNFHLRHCGKLKSLTALKGFSLYEDAVHAGYKPCKQCKPTPKNNLEISVPIYSKERPSESAEMLVDLCEGIGFQCERQRNTVQIETEKGIWRVYTNALPYKLEHINKIYGATNRTEFHTQPKIFLSLRDVWTYIKKHDGIADDVQIHKFPEDNSN